MVRFSEETLNGKLQFLCSVPKWKIEKVIGLMRDKLRGKIMKRYFGLWGKTYSCLIDDSSNNIKSPKMSHKKSLILKNIKTFYKQLNLRIKQTI